MNVAAANGIHLHYRVDGPARAPAMVLANSLGTDLRVWDRFVVALGDRFRVVRYDKRGHGLSEATPAPYVIDDHVADLDALLDTLGIPRAVVVGLSVGGMIALGLAARRPERVAALVLADTAHRIGPPEQWAARIEAVRAGGIEALAEPILERWFSGAFRRDQAAEVAAWRAMLVRTPVEGYLGTCAAIRDADLSVAAAGVGVPALCLCGSEDLATPPDLVRALAALVPGAGYAAIEGAGHLPCVEQAEAFTGAVRAFCEENRLG